MHTWAWTIKNHKSFYMASCRAPLTSLSSLFLPTQEYILILRKAWTGLGFTMSRTCCTIGCFALFCFVFQQSVDLSVGFCKATLLHSSWYEHGYSGVELIFSFLCKIPYLCLLSKTVNFTWDLEVKLESALLPVHHHNNKNAVKDSVDPLRARVGSNQPSLSSKCYVLLIKRGKKE